MTEDGMTVLVIGDRDPALCPIYEECSHEFRFSGDSSDPALHLDTLRADCFILQGFSGDELGTFQKLADRAPVVAIVRSKGEEQVSFLSQGIAEVLEASELDAKDLHISIESAVARYKYQLNKQQSNESELSEVRKKLLAIYEQSQEFMGLLCPLGKVLEANRAVLVFTEISFDIVKGKLFWECPWFRYTEGGEKQVRRAVEKAMQGSYIQILLFVKAPDGMEKQVEITLTPIKDGSGSVTHIVASGREVSALYQAELALRDSEEKFRETFEKCPTGLAHIGLDGEWLRFNSRVLEITGYSSDDLKKLTFTDITHPDDHQKDVKMIEKLRSGIEESYSLEKRYFRNGGEEVWVNVAVSAMRDKLGKILYYIASIEDITRRVRTLRELDEQKVFVERMTYVMPILLHVFNFEELRSVYVNRRATEVLGYNKTEMEELGDDFAMKLLHPEDLGKIQDFFQAMRKAGEGDTFEVEYRMLHRNGSWRWFRGLDSPFRWDKNGDVVEFIGTATDITREKLDKERIQASEQRLALGVSVAGLALVEIDFEGQTAKLTSEAKELLVVSEPSMEMALTDFSAIFGVDGIVGLKDLFGNCFGKNGDGSASVEHSFPLADGSLRWVRMRLQVYFENKTERAEPTRGVLAILNFTSEKLASEKVSSSEERFRHVFEFAGTGIAITDRDGRTLRANPVFCKLLGYDEGELGKMSPKDLVHQEDWTVEHAHAKSLLEGKEESFELENRFVTKGGKVVWVRKFVSRLKVAGSEEQIVTLVTDVTERRRTEQELREVSRRKDKFLAMLGHELRNPLGAIRQAVEVNKSASVRDEDKVWAKEVIDRQSMQLSKMVDDLLDIARIKRGRIELQQEKVDIGEILHRVKDTMRMEILSGEIEVDSSQIEEGLVVCGDKARLEQVFSNLLNNAIKFTPAGGKIRLEAAGADSEVKVTVEDNGAGIHAETLPYLFDLFRQENTTLDRAQGGLGIGLTVVKSLVELHEGEVHAFSEGIGKGSRFTVNLKLVKQVSGTLNHAIPTTDSEKDTKKILVVDDHKDAADGLAMLLRAKGHEVEVCYNGADVLKIAYSFLPNMFLLDLGLPLVDGYQLASMLRKDKKFANTSLVAISGYAQKHDREKSERAGFDYHFSKPVDFKQLMTTVDSLKRLEAIG